MLCNERERKQMSLLPCQAVALSHDKYIYLTLCTANEANLPIDVINDTRNVRKVSAYSVAMQVNWLF
jgi:hypothetical protein